MTNREAQLLSLPKIGDARGNLTFVEGGNHIPFSILRAYWIYDVPGGERRGGHAYRQQHELIIAASGSFDVVYEDSTGAQTIGLNRSYVGLYVPPMVWRQLANFSTNSVALMLASTAFDEADYVRNYDEFVQVTRGTI